MDIRTLIVYDSSDAISRGVLAVLCDWVASEWAQPFAYVSVAEVNRHGSDLGNVVVKLAATAATGVGLARMRDLDGDVVQSLVAVDPMGPGEDLARRRRRLFDVAERLNRARQYVRSVDLVVLGHGQHWSPARDLQFGAWLTLVCAPEDPSTSSAPGTPIFCSSADSRQASELAANAAAFCASVLQMWVGMGSDPIAGITSTSGQSGMDLRLGRATHSRLDSVQVADELRSQVLTEGMLHDPRVLAASSLAPLNQRVGGQDGVIKKVKIESVPPSRSVARQEIGAMDSLRLFFAFMIKSLLRAPRDLLIGMVDSAKRRTAESMQRSIFGDNSKMQVSVQGVSSADADVLQVQQSQLEYLAERIASSGQFGNVEAAVLAQQEFWNSVTSECLALVSGEAVGTVFPVNEGGRPCYYPVRAIAPPIPPPQTTDVAALPDLPTTSVNCYEPLAVMALRKSLRERLDSHSPLEQKAASRALDHLDEGFRAWDESFIGQVGRKLAEGVGHFSAQADRLLSMLHDSGGTDDSLQRATASLQKVSRIITGVAILVLIVAVVLHFTLLPGLALLIAVPLIIAVWFFSLLGWFWRANKRVFQLLHRADELSAQVDRVRAELPVAVENALRLTRVCAQYQIWAPALSVFLNEPFGREPSKDLLAAGLTGAVPKSVACGAYVIKDKRAAHEQAAIAAQSARVPLSVLWRRFRESSHDEVIRSKPQFRAIPVDDIASQAATVEGSYLQAWFDAFSSSTPEGLRMDSMLAAELDKSAMAHLVDNSPQAALSALKDACTIEAVGDGGRYRPAFIVGAADAPAFNAEILSHEGVTTEAGEVDRGAGSVDHAAGVRQQSTRHWFDVVSTAVVFSRPLSFSKLETKPFAVEADSDYEAVEPPKPTGIGSM